MKNFLKNLILLAVAAVLVYQFRLPLKTKFEPVLGNLTSYLLSAPPCEEPIPYTLGNFDSEFNISEKYFLEAMAEAEAVWEKPYGKELFTYAPEDSSYDVLKINLVYDFRQEATKTLSSLGITVQNTRASYDSLKSKFTALKASYEKDKNSLNSRIASFNQKSAEYEKEVNYWNNQGGAPEEEFNKLQVRRLELEGESRQLRNLENSINKKAEELNAMVVVLNRLATALNLTVEKYNTVNVARGESFEEGVFYSEGFKRAIDVYEFSSRSKLVRVLAHELGHALGLEHVEDPKAIMYEYNQGNSITLSKSDLAALELKCQE